MLVVERVFLEYKLITKTMKIYNLFACWTIVWTWEECVFETIGEECAVRDRRQCKMTCYILSRGIWIHSLQAKTIINWYHNSRSDWYCHLSIDSHPKMGDTCKEGVLGRWRDNFFSWEMSSLGFWWGRFKTNAQTNVGHALNLRWAAYFLDCSK